MPDARPAPIPSARLGERVAIVAGGVVAFFSGYFAAGLSVDPGRAVSLHTPVDGWIPFVPETIHLYAWVYTAALFPAFVVRSPRLFRRVALAYAGVLAVCLACFAVLPVGARDLRPDVSGLAPSFHAWGVRLAYALDPPLNLFPSVHVATATLAALSAASARPLYGAIAGAALVPIALSICTVKQHYALDGLAGIALGAGAWALCVRGRVFAGEGPRAFGWLGPAAYVLLHVLIYCALYGAYAGGLAPWEWVQASR